MDNFTILLTFFAMACFIGYFVIWGVTPALYSPLMSVSNAISGIVILGAITSGDSWWSIIAAFLASINIFGGFSASRRMLSMFRKEGKNK